MNKFGVHTDNLEESEGKREKTLKLSMVSYNFIIREVFMSLQKVWPSKKIRSISEGVGIY